MSDIDGEKLVEAMRRSADELSSPRGIRDLDVTLEQIVTSAVETIPGVDDGSISMTEGGRVDTRHPTNDAIRRLDETQNEFNEGPCLAALETPPDNGVVVAQDLADADADADAGRWPRFAPIAVEAGYRGLLSTQLRVAAGPLAALNLYAHDADVFDEHARTLAGLFGAQAALLLYGAENARHLRRAVDSRDVIGQAKGIVMERFTLDDDGVFQLLVQSSQETNMKLIEVARWLVGEVTARRSPETTGTAAATRE
ncbi:GAF and ANTAR domain-containing protein [Actinomycetospora chibensis]|uniref:GAF and ANTAR domain-containing protein n=1 Tax=Actinomycetospora chibensis TaxID=663606 RepID=A0ABV9RDQ4_9PSEU|nr:GAF and ANTAR domain-containing protein [Actinomycetospora chibensis]MDD7923966.1 GAF and ANTAR domain-containing protein [Actinomycetospora chibensis]